MRKWLWQGLVVDGVADLVTYITVLRTSFETEQFVKCYCYHSITVVCSRSAFHKPCPHEIGCNAVVCSWDSDCSKENIFSFDFLLTWVEEASRK